MADRYQDRPFSADDDDRGDDPHAPARGETDPLAELARLIGQTDPFGSMGRANAQVQPRAGARDEYLPPAAADLDEAPPAGPPPWMQRANRQEVPQQDYPSSVHPLQRYASARAAPPVPDYEQAQPFAEGDPEPDPSRYDEALYGQLDSGDPQTQHDPAYADDADAYQDGYGEEGEARLGLFKQCPEGQFHLTDLEGVYIDVTEH